jgi:peroxiredoxin
MTNANQTAAFANTGNLDTTQTLLIGSSAPDFSLTTIDKDTFRLSDKKGKTIIMFGVAGWCGECIPEGKALTQIKKDYATKGVEIIGVAFTKGDNDDLLKQYKQVGGIDIPLALDTDNVANKYQIRQLETTYIIKNGKVVYKDEQFTSYSDYKKELDKIL